MKKKYTLYVWMAHKGEGYGICKFGEFTPKLGYKPESGHLALPSEKIGDFSTFEELLEVMKNAAPDYYEYYSAEFEAIELLKELGLYNKIYLYDNKE